MGKDNNRHSLLSTHTMCRLAESQDDYIIIPLDECRYTFNDNGLERMRRTLEMSGASFVYSDYIDNGEIQRLIPWQEGSLRDDFDFGKIVMVRSADLKKAVSGMDEEYEAAGWYDLRLRLTRDKAPTYCPEPLYTIEKFDPESGSEENQFAYVDPRNRTSQIEMERAATRHLKAIKAYVSPKDKISVDVSQGAYPVEASVIIPVRNRHLTIADAVESALSQVTDFPFNIIVVDNRSDDGTSEILYRLEKRDPRVKVINTSGLPYPYIGIGGCWNIAVNSEYCGRFAIQLDSDDLYSGRDTLQKIVEKFRSEGCAMVIGSYTLTDFECNILPPGLIDHSEWTAENGANNALRINGLGAPRAFFTPVARALGFPDVCYGEDYAMGLAISRRYLIGRIYESLYLCRRWHDNTDHALSREKINQNNYYKDYIRTLELKERQSCK
ncbi:glycosyltransferase family 2 protein [uncultured Duncaniella sp.]|uniref:glycosyltransferase family 2 protein n=2 Tax=uncultured Duncaniella sp. TaxID=2768039 RepID=UPI0025FFE1CC|nr:glycosyltransferase family 2 protein [uncultured Duncaniella sp.]